MPIKLSASVPTRNKESGKITLHHDYLKPYSSKKLVELLTHTNVNKKKAKIRNELVRRGHV
jgi:hypothetical protein